MDGDRPGAAHGPDLLVRRWRAEEEEAEAADAKALMNATSFVFSLDDLQGSWEHPMWQDLINFVKNPSSSNISTVEATMDQQATAALGH